MNRQNEPEEMSMTPRPFWVLITIGVGQVCPLTDIDDQIHDIDVQHVGRVCRSEAILGQEDDIEIHHEEHDIGDECIADVFSEHDCVPHISGVLGEDLLVRFHPSDPSQIAAIVSDLGEMGFDATVERILRLDDTATELPPVLCDFSLLTEKQRIALQLAVDQGYYDTPRQTTLAELADRLDIGKSAVSHRLNAAESTIIRNYLPRTGDF